MNRTIIVGMLGLLALVQATPFVPSVGFAQTDVVMPFSTAGFQSGVIDEVQGSMIRIDGRSYVLKPGRFVITKFGAALAVSAKLTAGVFAGAGDGRSYP